MTTRGNCRPGRRDVLRGMAILAWIPFCGMAQAGQDAAPAAEAVRPGPMLQKAWAGPMKGVEELVSTWHSRVDDIHWYVNFGYLCHNPARKMTFTGSTLSVVNIARQDVRVLLDDPNGAIRDPQVHYDGRTILFSWRKGGSDYHHLYEVQSDGTGLRQITDGPWDDIEPTYLPNDEIAFISSRCKRWVPCNYTQVGTLYRCDRQGRHPRAISCNVEHDNTPSVLPDGRLAFTRWEYVDRSYLDYHHLWTMNPDGTGTMALFGNMHRGGLMLRPAGIAGSGKMVSNFIWGHSDWEHHGAVVLIDPDLGPDARESVRQISPGEFNWWKSRDQYNDPFAFAPDCILAGHGNGGLWLLDGNSAPERISNARAKELYPLRPRPRERIIPDRTDRSKDVGTLVLTDVGRGRNMAGVRPGDIKKLLVLEVLPIPVHFGGSSAPITLKGSHFVERIIGAVPVEPDGSAYFEVPALRPVFFVALDANGMSVKRMQSYVHVMPGETTGCVGCHEQRSDAVYTSTNPAALRRQASKPVAIEGVPEIIDMVRHVQPILDRRCVKCHNAAERKGGVVLTGHHGCDFSLSYANLIVRNQIADGANGTGNKAPREIGSSASPLLCKADPNAFGLKPHHGVALSPAERQLIRLWVDSAAAYTGTYASLGCGAVEPAFLNAPKTRTVEVPDLLKNRKAVKQVPVEEPAAVVEAREAYRRRCAGCHARQIAIPQEARSAHQIRDLAGKLGDVRKPAPYGGKMCLAAPPGPAREFSYFERVILPDDPCRKFSEHVMFDLTAPEESSFLLAPLPKAAGGYASCRPVDPNDPNAAPGKWVAVFRDAADPDYAKLLGGVRHMKAKLDRIGRFDMPGFRPNEHYVREMKRYGVLSRSFDPNTSPIDVYATDQAYWRSLWWQSQR
jgi:hypothetical protein